MPPKNADLEKHRTKHKSDNVASLERKKEEKKLKKIGENEIPRESRGLTFERREKGGGKERE